MSETRSFFSDQQGAQTCSTGHVPSPDVTPVGSASLSSSDSHKQYSRLNNWSSTWHRFKMIPLFPPRTSTRHRGSPSLPTCLPLPTVHCVISGSFQCDAEICKSALLVSSTSDRIILKHGAACLPVRPFLLPGLIRLTEAWPQQLFQAFPQYHIHQKGCHSGNLQVFSITIKYSKEGFRCLNLGCVGSLHRGGVKVKNKTLRHRASRAGLDLNYCNWEDLSFNSPSPVTYAKLQSQNKNGFRSIDLSLNYN